MTAFYCWDCETMQYEDDLGRQSELMDPSVPGSWMHWTCCGHCGSDAIDELSDREVRSAINDLKDILTNPEPHLKTARMLIKFIDEGVEWLYE